MRIFDFGAHLDSDVPAAILPTDAFAQVVDKDLNVKFTSKDSVIQLWFHREMHDTLLAQYALSVGTGPYA